MRSAVGDARRELLALVGEAMEIVYVRRTFGAGHLGLGPRLGASGLRAYGLMGLWAYGLKGLRA
jgi:hypothetical protein